MTFHDLLNGGLREAGMGAKTPQMRGYVERVERVQEPEEPDFELFTLVFHGNPNATSPVGDFSFDCRRPRGLGETMVYPASGDPRLTARLLEVLASGGWETFRVADYVASLESREEW